MSLSWKRIKPKQEHFLPYYCAVFLVTGVLGFWGMWLQHRSMIWKIDGIGQYYPSFLYIGKYLRELIRGILRGEWKLPLYDLSIGFGEDIIGTLNYYGFGDPLNLLAVFATVRNGAYWFTAMYFLRAWLTGAAFGYYATGMGYKGRYAALGGVAYTFCGFALVGCAGYSQWYSWLMLLPLLLAGCEQVFRHHSAGAFLLTFSAFYGACCGFYFLYNTGLVLALYCVVRQLHIQGIRRSHVAFWECLRCLFYYSLGLLLAGPVFFPAMLAFFDSENADYSVWRVIQRANNYIPFFNKSFWKSLLIPFYVSKSQTTGISFFELLAIPVLFSQPKSKRKSQLSIALILCIAAMHFRIVGYLFNAFNEYNKRYVFAVHFTLAMVLVDALQYWFDVRRGNQRRISAGKFRFAVVAIAVIVSISGNIWKLFSAKDAEWGKQFLKFESVFKYVDSPVEHSDVIAGDRELYRITANTFTKINGRPVNLAMLYRYHSLQYWFSLSNVRVQKLVDFAYGAPQIGRAPGVSANSTLETLLGVKYSLAKPKHTRKEPYKKVETVKFQKKKWKVYQNLDYMGMAYLRNEEKANRLWQETEATGQYQTYFEQVLKDRKERAHADILDLHYEGNSFSCSVKAAKGDEAVFAIPYHSNWQAFVDGKKTATSTRDMAFLAIPLEEGDHEICLKYVSGSFRAGIAAMFLSMCVIALSRILYFRRK